MNLYKLNKRFIFVTMWLTIWIVVSSCDVSAAEPNKAHHTATGFTNPDEQEDTGFFDFMKWRWSRFWVDAPGPEAYNFPLANSEIKFLNNNRTQTTVTWIGHATVLVQTNGVNILTDPQFSNRASPIQWLGPKRAVKPGIELNDLPAVHFVVISHDHYDSLDSDSINTLFERQGGEDTVFIVPLKLKQWFVDFGITNVIELDWWETYQVQQVKFTAVPARHWSKRTLFSKNKTLWAGWVITADDFNFYFCGDSGYTPWFRDIGEKLGPFDIAAIPIGAYEPRWFMKSKHINPEEAVLAHKDLRAKKSIAIHWGTFILTDEPLDEPPVKLQEALHKHNIAENEFLVLKHGETVSKQGKTITIDN